LTSLRPGFKKLIRLALTKGREAVLVVAKLDRLGRNAIDVQETLALLLDAGVRVVSLSDGVDSASGMGAAILKLLTNILATFAEHEKEVIKTRLLDGRKRADRENRVYASEPRYGRRVAEDGRQLVEDPTEAQIVERVRALRAEGKPYRAICEALHLEGFTPRKATSWSPTVVRRIPTG
jgi:putative DNA-invertase from lambdoid prophage Rac